MLLEEVVVVMVVLGRGGRGLSGWRRRRRGRWKGRLWWGRWSHGLAVQTQVLVLLAEPVQLHLQLLDPPALRLQQLLLALDDVVELQQVFHRPVGALGAPLACSLASVHG